MSENDIGLKEKVVQIKSVWKQLALLGVWIAAIASSFLLPLPDWDSEEQTTSKTRFILFISTVIAGFILLLTFKYKQKKTWIYISVTFLILFIISYYLYDIKRENNTLPYYETTKVIGYETLKDFDGTSKRLGVSSNDRDLLKYVAGDATRLWTKESIERNRNELVFYLTLSYCLLSVFMIAFINLFLITTPRNVS